MDAREQVLEVIGDLDGCRIASATRVSLNRKLARLASDVPVTVDEVPNPLVDEESYGGKYYWQYRDRAAARLLSTGYPSVRAVRIDSDIEDEDTPRGWYPRVELTLGVNDHVLVGDLDADAAVRLATSLLAAAALIKH